MTMEFVHILKRGHANADDCRQRHGQHDMIMVFKRLQSEKEFNQPKLKEAANEVNLLGNDSLLQNRSQFCPWGFYGSLAHLHWFN